MKVIIGTTILFILIYGFAWADYVQDGTLKIFADGINELSCAALVHKCPRDLIYRYAGADVDICRPLIVAF